MPAIASRFETTSRCSLSPLPPLEPVVRGRSDQQGRGDRGAEERQEVDVLLEVGHLAEALRERHAEQEREQHLDAGERDAQLVQELDQLPIEPFLLALIARHVLMISQSSLSDANERSTVRIESSVTAISWIPSEAVEGLPKIPFTMGVAHYDDPPPDVIEDLDAMREADLVPRGERAARVHRVRRRRLDHGCRPSRARSHRRHADQGRPEGAERRGRRAADDPGRARDRRRLGALHADGGRPHGHAPAPRRVSGKPFFRINSAIAWTTLALTIKADGSSEHELAGASPFPRHWVYDKDGQARPEIGDDRLRGVVPRVARRTTRRGASEETRRRS